MNKKLLFLLIIPLLLIPVYAQESKISVQTNDNHYEEGDIIVISGKVSTVIGSLSVTSQIFLEDSLVDIVQVTVAQDGTFSHTVIAEGPLWTKIGDYLVRVSYGEGNIAETKFSYTPKSESVETTTIFEVNAGSNGTFDVEYTIKGGTVKNMIIDPEHFSIIVQIEATDHGTISLDLPREFIGAEKQDGKDDTFIILIDGIEVAYQESVVHSDSRVITINFEEEAEEIKIIANYLLIKPEPKKETMEEIELEPIVEQESININQENEIYSLKQTVSELQKDNTQLKVENRKLSNSNNVLQSEIDELNLQITDLYAIIMEQIKVFMEVLQEIKSK